MDTEKPGKLIMKLVGGGIMGLFVLIAGCESIYVVDTGTVGVVRNFREVTGETVQPGIHVVNGLTTDIVEMSTQVLRWDEKTDAYTKDLQTATVSFTLTYKLDSIRAPQMYSDYREEWAQRVVGQVVVEDIKREMGQHNAVDLIAQRAKAAGTMAGNISERLREKGVIVTDFALRDISYDAAFEKSIEQKVVAQQKAIEEQNRTVQIEEQAKQTVATARGAADATLLNAKANAESIRIRAEALANNPKLVELVKAERWDGKLPTTVMGGAIPFFNVPQGQ